MKIECDTEKLRALSKDIDIEIEKYKEIIKKFYSIVDSFEVNAAWVGESSKNYSKYLHNKKKNYDYLYDNLISFNNALKTNINEIEYAIKNSGVNEND